MRQPRKWEEQMDKTKSYEIAKHKVWEAYVLGERVMESVVRFVEGKLRLKVNRDKSAVDRPWAG